MFFKWSKKLIDVLTYRPGDQSYLLLGRRYLVLLSLCIFAFQDAAAEEVKIEPSSPSEPGLEASPSASEAIALPSPHFFNAAVLPESTLQIGMTGNVNYGLFHDTQVGAQGLFWLLDPQIGNLYLKHKMFQTNSSQTAFFANIFLSHYSNAQHIVSFTGLLNTRPVFGNSHFLSLGLMDLMLSVNKRGRSMSTHLLTPTVAWDTQLDSAWGLSLIAARPVYAVGESKSKNYGSGSVSIDLNKTSDTLAYLFGSVTYTYGSFHLEAGALSFSTDLDPILPYVNLFWRFHGI
jgi:hypothetical protein